MIALTDSKQKMLNPIFTKFLQINNIYFSKSFSIFGPVASIDPNSYQTHKMLYQEEKPQVKATTAVEANLPNTSVDYSLENQMAAGTSFSGIAAGAHLPPP